MDAPREALEDQIEELSDRAKRIEKLYCEFFQNVGTHKGSGGMHRFWNTPSGDIEETQRDALGEYEIWYNTGLPLVKEYLPDRINAFEGHYEKFKERIQLQGTAWSDPQKAINRQNSDFDTQCNILRSIPAKVEAEELKVRKQISQEVSQTEFDKAEELFEEGEIRASGVIAGIALERYLLMKCENTGEIEYRYNDGISSLAQKLFEADVIDSTPEKHLQHLADIRAGCAHANEEDPCKADVKRLLDDVNDYIRGRKL